MEEKQGFWSRVWADLCDKELLPLKILFFIKASTAFVLYPYLNIHSKTLGLNVEDVGVTNALTILTVVGQPLAGVFSDKIGNFKVLLTIITLITPIPALLMLAIPPARETFPLPGNMTFIAECAVQNHSTHSLSFNFQNLEDYDCHFKNDTTMTGEMQQQHQLDRMPNIQCGYLCEDDEIKQLPFLEHLPVPAGVKYTIHRTNKSFITFDDMTKNLICEQNDVKHGRTLCEFHLTLSNSSNNALSTVNLISAQSDNNSKDSKRELKFNGFALKDGSIIMGKCKQEPEPPTSPRCEFKCLAQVRRALFCSNTEVVKVYDEKLTFWVYNVLRVALALLSSTCWIMFEGAVLAIIKERGGDYGIQRATVYLAAIIMAPLSGYLIRDFTDFRPAFYLYAALQVLSGVLTMKISLDFKEPGKQVFGSLLKVLKKAQVVALLLAVLASGIAWGFLESFLFWFLQNLGGSGLLLGLTTSVSGLSGLPFLILNQPIINRFGHVNTIALGLIFYGIRLVGYSLIHDPWMSLPYEALEAVTSSLAITAANTYGSQLSTPDTVVSVQGLIGALYYSVGRSVGSLIGGYLMKFYGDRTAFQALAAISAVAGLLYFFFNAIHRSVKSKGPRKSQCRADGKLDQFRYDGGFVPTFPVNDALSPSANSNRKSKTMQAMP